MGLPGTRGKQGPDPRGEGHSPVRENEQEQLQGPSPGQPKAQVTAQVRSGRQVQGPGSE